MSTKRNKPRITTADIHAAAKRLNIPADVIYAIHKVESHGAGFLKTGEPKILFERHKFWDELEKIDMLTIRNEMRQLRPDLCHPNVTPRGGYGSEDEQHQRLDDAVRLIFKVRPDADEDLFFQIRECALKACSWGLGQLMGFNHKICGFDDVQEFVNAMYRSEAAQFDAMLNFLVSNGMLDAMRQRKWHSIARTYNGRAYAKHNYHGRLQAAAQSFNG